MKAVLISLAIGGVLTSTAEYFLHYNLVDKIVDLFRSAEAIAQTQINRGEALVSNARAKLNRLRAGNSW
jgi:hypothetical protein